MEDPINKIEKCLEERGYKRSHRADRKGLFTSGSNWIAGKNFDIKIENGKVTIAKNGKHGFIIKLYWSDEKDILKSAESLAILCYDTIPKKSKGEVV